MEIEIIGLVDVEVTPIRWNHDGTMFMDDTFRWYPADVPATLEANGLPDGWMAETKTSKACVICGAFIPPTGKVGRPKTRCTECENVN